MNPHTKKRIFRTVVFEFPTYNYHFDFVSNGDFSEGDTNWTLGTGWSVKGGKATCAQGELGTPLAQDFAALSNTPTAGKLYLLTYTSDANIGGGSITPILGGTLGTANTEFGEGTVSELILCGSDDSKLKFRQSRAWSGTIDDVILEEVGTFHVPLGTMKMSFRYKTIGEEDEPYPYFTVGTSEVKVPLVSGTLTGPYHFFSDGTEQRYINIFTTAPATIATVYIICDIDTEVNPDCEEWS